VAHLQFAQVDAQTKNCKRASTSPTQKEFQNIFSNASKKIKHPTHKPDKEVLDK